MDNERRKKVFGLDALHGLWGDGTTSIDQSRGRSGLEDEVFVALPGDDRSRHPKQYKFNPWVNKPPTETLRLLREGKLSEDEKAQVLEALQILSRRGEMGGGRPD